MIVAVTISKGPVDWSVLDIPHVCLTEGYQDIQGPTEKSRERIEYLSKRRTLAHLKALEEYPKTTHFFDVDSYYTEQTGSIRKLAKTYAEIGKPEIVLGGATWLRYRDIFRVLGYERPFEPYHYWDTWTTPEATNLSFTSEILQTVKAVGGVCIYPVEAFKKNGFGPRYFPTGSEYNQLCEGYTTVLDTGTRFIHPLPANLRYGKRLRVFLGGKLR